MTTPEPPTRTVRDLQRLSGRRGPRENHALTWGDVDALMADIATRAQASNGAYPKTLGTVDVFTYDNDTQLINGRIDNTITYVDNEVALARSDLNAIIDSDVALARTDLQAEIDSEIASARSDLQAEIDADVLLARTELDATIDSEITSARSDLQAAIDSGDSALDLKITNLSSTVDQNTADITTESAARADADSALALDITSLTATVDGNTADITAEQIARSDADTALAADITALTSTVDGNTAAISTEQITRADADTALSGRIDTVEATAAGNTTSINNEQIARADADSALAADITSLTSTVDGNTTAITNEQTARADADSALAADITSLSTTVDGNTSAIASEQTARSDADTALAADITSLSAEVDDVQADITDTAYVRANGDGGVAAQLVTINTSVGDNAAAISSEQIARADADTALSGRVDTVEATAGDNTTAINNEQIARADADSALAADITSLTATVDGNTADITAEQVARADADTALSGRIDTLTATVDGNTADITAEQIARTDADSALASDITTLQTDFNGLESSVTTNATAISTIDSYNAATYAIRLVAGGATNSVEFVAADDPIDGPTSSVRFTADNVLFENSLYARHIASETITGQEIAADTLTARHVLITADAGNQIQDPYFEDPALWEATGVQVVDAAQAAWNTPNVLQMDGAGGDYLIRNSRPFPVEPGEQFAAGFQASVPNADGNALCQLQFSSDNSFSAGSTIAYVAMGGQVSTIAVSTVSDSGITAPAGAKYARVQYVKQNNGATRVFIGNAYVRRMAGGELIVDGSITASKIDVADLSAISADLGTISVGFANIEDGAVTNRFAAANYIATSVGQVVNSIDIDCDGNPVSVFFASTVKGYHSGEARLRIDGSLVRTFKGWGGDFYYISSVDQTGAYYATRAFGHIINPGVGTFTVDVLLTNGTSVDYESRECLTSYLETTELKR